MLTPPMKKIYNNGPFILQSNFRSFTRKCKHRGLKQLNVIHNVSCNDVIVTYICDVYENEFHLQCRKY